MGIEDFFLRGKKFLARNINRIKIKGNGARMASNPEEEPNFYIMSSLPASGDSKIIHPISAVPSCASLIPLNNNNHKNTTNNNTPPPPVPVTSADAQMLTHNCSAVTLSNPGILAADVKSENLFFMSEEEDVSSRASSYKSFSDSRRLCKTSSNSLSIRHISQEEDATFLKEMEEFSKMIESEEKKKDYDNNIKTASSLNINDFSEEEVDFLLDFFFEC